MTDTETGKKITGGVLVIVLLAVCLCITTVALVYEGLLLENNRFSTGRLRIDLNGGKPIIQETELHFEPGMSVEKEFFIRNDGTVDAYYKLYWDQVSGDLADVLDIAVESEGKALYRGTATQLTRQAVGAAEDVLHAHEARTLTVRFFFPKERGGEVQNGTLSFVLCAEATQVKNNPNRVFS